ncbi:aminotransferase class I/II-fold pyridoxal phosphate-dependent enzyme [Robiginitalea sp. SC105]|uniref:aminotransferase class I/II-fold pyridoxal phosphate-dependent enzyme n=1 Tax=Robiginitalea sp. SC105 TaxID=2762332 RepID=UPI00163977A2|nr:aminotransferase class I/II-fold pyridoxal phosphate-dependent enzyme [Robiginitalea sp. SC105]MBC2837975.1 aminotransferase class I/II-fold pyridoxal phosphate-dependent enzyme [Robiginitalea sp. SC105]
MTELPSKLREKLMAREREGNLRSLSPAAEGVDFYSNDYLGFAREDPAVYQEGSKRRGSGGSRLISGNHPLYDSLEQRLCTVHRSEAALVFNSGYDANIGLLSAVPQRTDYVFYDQSVHASIRDGLALGRARTFSFAHNSLQGLEERVGKVLPDGVPRGAEAYVVTESVFSMEGDSPDLKALAAYCAGRGFRLLVDEAHAAGIIGPKGEGVIAESGLEGAVFARIVTFGKALGRHGAAILCRPDLREYLVNFSRSLIYTTALPPDTLEGILQAYDTLTGAGGDERRARLRSNIACFREKAADFGLAGGFHQGGAAIQTFRVGDTARAGELGRKINAAGFLVKPILYPTVPRGMECLRICLHSFNTDDEIQGVLSILSREYQPGADE